MDFDAARAAVLAAVPAAERTVAVAAIDPKPYARGDQVGVDRQFRSVDAPLWMGFIDLQPNRNWGHRALTVLVKQDGGVEVIEAQFPPVMAGGRRLQPIKP